MPLPSSTPTNPSPSRLGEYPLVLEASPYPEGQPHHGGLAVVYAVVNDYLHSLNEEQPQQDSDVSGGHGAGDGDKQGGDFGEEGHQYKDDADGDAYAPGGDAGNFGKGYAGGVGGVGHSPQQTGEQVGLRRRR